MAYPKGKPRPEGAGRQKGTPNKSTQDLEAICEKHGVNVFEAMIMIIKDTEDKPKRFEMLSKVADYLYSKRKQVEVETGDKGFVVRIEDYSKK